MRVLNSECSLLFVDFFVLNANGSLPENPAPPFFFAVKKSPILALFLPCLTAELNPLSWRPLFTFTCVSPMAGHAICPSARSALNRQNSDMITRIRNKTEKQSKLVTPIQLTNDLNLEWEKVNIMGKGLQLAGLLTFSAFNLFGQSDNQISDQQFSVWEEPSAFADNGSRSGFTIGLCAQSVHCRNHHPPGLTGKRQSRTSRVRYFGTGSGNYC